MNIVSLKIKLLKINIMRHHHQNPETNGRIIAGVIILTAGLLFMLNNFNVLPPRMEHYIFSWKTLLIAIGTLNLLFSHNRTAGFILITVGVVFWIPDIFVLPINAGKFIWPLAIIVVGLFILFKRPDGSFGHRFWEDRFRNNHDENETENAGEQASFSQNDFINNVAVFGGGSYVITSKNFKGGKLTAIFGGSEIHLQHAKLAPGKHILDILFLFGGSEIIVPPDWNIKIEVVSIFGGFSDKRFVRKPEEITDEKHSFLVIKGLVIFGGAEIKSY